MKIKEAKTYRTLLSYLLVLCIVFGLVGSHAPAGTVKAGETASSYTVTLNGRSDSSHFWMYNETASNGPITLSYTVKELSTDNVGRNGVVANQTTAPYKDWPCDYGSAYRTAKDASTNKHTNHFMKVGCTYTLTIGKDASGAVTFSGSYQDAQGTTHALTPISDWADWSQSGPIGPKNASYKHFGVHFTSSVTGTLTNVTCVDGSGNDLGITSNQTGAYAIEVEKEAEKVEPPSYTVTLNGHSSNSHFWIYNETESNGPITLSYTVKELSSDNIGRNGVVANQATAPYKDWPCDYGSHYRTAKNTETNKHTNHFMKIGCTYTLTIGKDANGAVTFGGSYQDAEGTTHALTPISDWADWSQNGPIGPKNTSYKHFGVHMTSSVTGTLTNVTCVDAEGNDLGITSNQTGEYSCNVKKDVKYTVAINGRTSDSHYLLSNKEATSGPITLRYTVKELSSHATYGNYVGRNGVVATSDSNVAYPYDFGSSYTTYKNADTTNGTYTNRFMKVGCTYTLTMGLDANGAITFTGSYVDGEGVTHALTPISDWADWSQSGAIGPKNTSYKHFGVHFTSSVTGILVNVTCMDADGNDLGITSNQTTCVITGGPDEQEPGGDQGGDSGEEPGGNQGGNPGGSQEDAYDSTNWTKYNVTLGGSESSLFLSNKTATSGPVILRYTVAETSAKESAGNNGVVASTSPTAPFPYAYGNGSMLFNAPTNNMMKAGCTYTLKLSLDANGFVTVDGYYIDAAGNKTGNLKAYIPRTTGTNNKDCQHFGIYIERKITALLTNVSCVDENGKDLGLQVNQLGCTFENLSGDTGDAVVEEKLPSDYTLITLGNFGIKDGTYRGTFRQGFYALSMHKTVFSVDIEFSTDLGEDIRYGSRVDGWHGLRFWSQENNLHMQDVDGYTKTYVFDMVVANMKLVGEKINLKISTEYVDSDSDGVKDDVKLGVWFNDKLYNNEYIYLKNYKNVLGKYMSVYSAAKAAYITVSSVEGVHTGVDYSIWGYTNNWKKEMGIE